MGPLRYCATCGSTDVHPSRLRTEFEALMLPFLFRPYRCWHCSRRFYGFLLAMKGRKTRPVRLNDDLFGRGGVEGISGLASTSSNFSSGTSANFCQSDDWDLLMPKASFTVGASDCGPLSAPRPLSSIFIDLREDPKAWMQMENELLEDVRSPDGCRAPGRQTRPATDLQKYHSAGNSQLVSLESARTHPRYLYLGLRHNVIAHHIRGRMSLGWRWFLSWSLKVIHTDTFLESIYFLYRKRHAQDGGYYVQKSASAE